MSGRCEECGDSTIWDQELGSAICTHCGTLADPTQSVLTSHLEHTDTSGREFFWNTVQGGTLKGRNGWALSGQGKEVRDRRNTVRYASLFLPAYSPLAYRLQCMNLSSRSQPDSLMLVYLPVLRVSSTKLCQRPNTDGGVRRS